MKTFKYKTVLIFLVANFVFALAAFNQVISTEHQEKAAKEGKSESAKLQKKGWINSLPDTDFERSFIRAYEAKYTEDANGINLYVPAFGNAIADSKEEAEKQALDKCKKGMLDIMMFYYLMWNTSNSNISDSEKKEVEDAINLAGENIKAAYNELKYETVVSIYRNQAQECKNITDHKTNWLHIYRETIKTKTRHKYGYINNHPLYVPKNAGNPVTTFDKNCHKNLYFAFG